MIDEGSRESRGWGDQHDWVTLLDAMIEGCTENKDYRIFIHFFFGSRKLKKTGT